MFTRVVAVLPILFYPPTIFNLEVEVSFLSKLSIMIKRSGFVINSNVDIVFFAMWWVY